MQFVCLYCETRVKLFRCFSKTQWTQCETKPNSDQEEVDKFSRIAFGWWDESGDFKALHTLNSLRIPLIRDGLCRDSISNVTQPLKVSIENMKAVKKLTKKFIEPLLCHDNFCFLLMQNLLYVFTWLYIIACLNESERIALMHF